MTDQTNKLEPCPFCQYDEIRAEGRGWMYWNVCDACGTRGPIAYSADEAITAWNRRASAPEVYVQSDTAALRAAFKAHCKADWADPTMVYEWDIFHAGYRAASAPAAGSVPSTPEQVISFIGCNFNSMEADGWTDELPQEPTGDLNNVRYSLSVHDLLSAFSEWSDSTPAAGSVPSDADIESIWMSFYREDSLPCALKFARALLAQYVSPARWVPVSERLPESGDQVWISTTFSGVIAAKKEWRQGWAPDYWETAIGDLDMSDVTHWKPYFPPPPPQEDQ